MARGATGGIGKEIAHTPIKFKNEGFHQFRPDCGCPLEGRSKLGNKPKRLSTQSARQTELKRRHVLAFIFTKWNKRDLADRKSFY
jgi:hypothetical protein